MPPRRSVRGFTLIEVLVALAIVAVALSAGMRALAQGADGTVSLRARTLATWVAQNRLAQVQLALPWPSPGDSSGDDVQAGFPLHWQQSVAATPNPSFRRIDIVVSEPGVPEYALAHLSGYVNNAGR